ncbi:MAG: DEAD/DEAH box helicase [Rhodospirillales bacterium]|nr:DEAD/DEAH box helicase [Rhodospirillales bacterium]
MTEFEGVVPALGQALNKRGYEQLTPVQQAVLAPELVEADTLVSAQTGSGKTVAFGLAIAPTLLEGAERFPRSKTPVALVVAPTRELALQVKRELEWLYEMTGASIASCVGGMDMSTERRTLSRGANIVVGTPGRLRDHIERGSFNTSGLKAVVLDEADEMLDLGFRDDLEYILEAAPKTRRTLLFSATVPRTIASLAKRYQRDAVRIKTSEEQKQHLDIEYRALTVAPNERENAIINILRYYEAKTALVFCATRATVNHMTSRFANRGFSVVALSGELSQNERTHALQAMRDGRARVCIATDVAARGIDLPNLELVIHADIPKSREPLLHRSGRTGRAGRKGVSVLVVPHNRRKSTERLLGSANVQATWAKPPSVDDILYRDRQRVMESTTLTEPLSEYEQEFANELLKRHGPEQVAAAFVRQHFASLTAPEELLDNAPKDRQQRSHDDFKDGVWLALSVGREQSAEARWLLPMLCRVGLITKRDIGRIQIHQDVTHVELTKGSVDKFLQTVGPSGNVEENITVTRLEGVPTPPPAESKGSRDKPRGKKSFGSSKPSQRGKSDTKRKFTKKADKPEVKYERPEPSEAPAGTVKPWEKTKERPAKKPKGKKPFKSKSGPKEERKSRRTIPSAPTADQPGSRPMKRKKPKKA